MNKDPEIILSGIPHEVHLAEGSNTALHKTATPMQPQVRNTLVNPDEEVEVVEVVKGVNPSQEEDARLTRGAATAAPEADRFLNLTTAQRYENWASKEGTPEPEGHAPLPVLPLTQVMSDLPSLDLPPPEINWTAAAGPTAPETPQSPEAHEPSTAIQEAAAQADTELSAVEVVAQVDEVAPEEVLSQAEAEVAPEEVTAQAEAEVAPEEVTAQAEAEVAPEEVTAQAEAEVAPEEVTAQAEASVPPAQVAAPPQFMEEMNFPARVVKLKIANDQVRGQIEKLEKPLLPAIPVQAPAAPKGKGKEAAAKPAKGH
jgi:hypothetical protein